MDRQSLFNQDFYPTPNEVIEKMLAFSDVRGKIILEPSAGQGNIVDYLKSNGAKEVIACEINEKLRQYVSRKCNVICNDFMDVTSEMVSHIDMIVMNPPFSKSKDHILHAWEVAPDGCEIISLCNSNTLSYCYTENEKKIKELIENHGSKEYIDNAFSYAERKTDVNVSIIRLYKPKKEGLEFSDYFTEEADDIELQTNGLIQHNFVRECVNRYVAAVSKFDAVMEASNEINELTKGIGGCNIVFGAHSCRNESVKITRDYFKKDLQKNAWRWIFDKFELDKYITRNVKENINKFVELQSNIPFTMKNIYRMVEMIVCSAGSIMQQALNDAFDTICSFSADNSTAGEKWKTNSSYMVNKKFIVPYMCSYEEWYKDGVHLGYSSCSDKIDDVIKVLCFLTGTNYDNDKSLYRFVNNNRMLWGEWYEFGFFRIKGYKKGTMHFEFLDDDLWYKFNAEVAKTRGWQLPQKSTKKR